MDGSSRARSAAVSGCASGSGCEATTLASASQRVPTPALWQYVCVLQEWELLPTWVKYAKSAGILRQLISNEMLFFADFTWRPWPLPPLSVLLRATLRRCQPLRHEQVPPALGESPIKEKPFLVTFSTPSASSFDRRAMPEEARSHFEVPLRKGVARLMPQPPGPEGGHRTVIEGVVSVELNKLIFLGPVRARPPTRGGARTRGTSC